MTLAHAQRNSDIDLLRGFSILSVILLHIAIRLPLANYFSDTFQSIYNVIFRSGYYGVIIFFVISGFLITMMSFKRWGSLQHIPLFDFYRIRFARIAPCLILFICISLTLHYFNISGYVIKNTNVSSVILAALTFHINWLEAKVGYLPGSWDVLWSLSVEEVFYLFFPLFCLTFKKQWQLITALLFFIAVAPLARTIFTSNEIWQDHSYLSCMDGIAFGCLAAILLNHLHLKQLQKLLSYFVGLMMAGSVLFFRKTVSSLGLTQFSLNVTALEAGIAMVLIGSTVITYQSKNIFSYVIRWLGKNSYEVYLSHVFIVLAVLDLLKNYNQNFYVNIFEIFLIVFLSGVVGQFVAKYFSNPLNNLLRSRQLILYPGEANHDTA